MNELPLPLRMTNVGQCKRLETVTEFHAEIVLPVLGPTKIEVRLVFHLDIHYLGKTYLISLEYSKALILCCVHIFDAMLCSSYPTAFA
jgi:hypothetical protein